MISQVVLGKWKKESPKLYFHAECLNKYSVVGFEHQKDFDLFKAFLDKNKVEYESNNRCTMWIDTLSEVLKTTFRKS